MEQQDPEETLMITDMIDCPSVEMKVDVGDIMFKNVVDYAKESMTDQDYFKVGFGLMLGSLGDKLIEDSSGQLIFDFNA
jgi:hypothetical protein